MADSPVLWHWVPGEEVFKGGSMAIRQTSLRMFSEVVSFSAGVGIRTDRPQAAYFLSYDSLCLGKRCRFCAL